MSSNGSQRSTGGAAGSDPARHYINHLDVGLSLSEIRLDFAMLGALPGALTPVWRFVTTPDHLQTMHGDMTVALDSYRARFGTIRAGGVDRSGDDPREDSRDG